MLKRAMWFFFPNNWCNKDEIPNMANDSLWKKLLPVNKVTGASKTIVRSILDDSWNDREIKMPDNNPELNEPRVNTIQEKRLNVRIKVNDILPDPRNNRVISISCNNGKHCEDELSNISLWWLQLLSRDNTKEIWDVMTFKFRLGIYNFLLKWEVSNIGTNKKGKTTYWIKFIDVPIDQKKAIEEILGSIKIVKGLY